MHATKTDVEDGIWYDYQINYDPSTTALEVYFDGSLRLTHFIDLKNEIFDGEDFVYWGFTAGTGGEHAPLTVSIENASFSITDDTICNGSTTVELPALDPSLQYAWVPNDGSIDDTTSANPTFTPTQTTTYTVTMPNLCSDPIEFEYTVYVNNESDMRANASIDSICKGDSVQISGSGGFNYQWSDNLEDGDKVALNSSKTFYLIGENEYGCFQADTVRVEVLEPIIADFDYTVNPDGSISFINNSSNANLFNWDLGNGDTLNAESPIYSYEDEGTYNVVLSARSNGFACEDSISKEVNAPCRVFIPTAFTPDNDLANDTWDLGCFENPDATVRVFNRWGALVYESKGGVDYVAWDGKGLGGNELPVGTYYYTIDGVNQEGVYNNGIVTIIR